MYSYNLTESLAGNNVPGNLISALTSVDTKNPVVMTQLNETTIAVYAADVLEEGAVMLIYNIQFKLVQAVQKLKLYTKDAKLWRVDDKLLLAANRDLAVAPYKLAPHRLESILGSSLNFPSDPKDDVVLLNESVIANWEEECEIPEPKSLLSLPDKWAKQFKTLISEGLSDAAIYELMMPQLIEAKDVNMIVWCLDNLKDLPEKFLIELLAFCVRLPDKDFTKMKNGESSLVTSKNDFLDKIFNAKYSDVSLLSHLKSGLNFQETLVLLNYVLEKLNEEDLSLDEEQLPTDQKLYDWATLLLDAHYQNYLLSPDEKVVQLLNDAKTVIDDHVS